jgi:hypothetical protein
LSKDLPGLGSILAFKISTVFTTIDGLSDFEHADIGYGERNPNKLNSPTKIKRMTLLDLGTVNATMWFDPNDTVHLALQAAFLAKTEVDMQYTYVDGLTTPAKVEIKGYIQEFPITGFGTEETVTSKIKIAVTGIYTPTAGTP